VKDAVKLEIVSLNQKMYESRNARYISKIMDVTRFRKQAMACGKREEGMEIVTDEARTI
jgi:hypothetical protein